MRRLRGVRLGWTKAVSVRSTVQLKRYTSRSSISLLSHSSTTVLTMFGGLGGALKGLSSKAEEMIEKTKTSVGEMASEKKAAAAAMLEAQAKKTSDALWTAKTDVEGQVVEGVNETKAAAIEGFDKEVSAAEQAIDQGVKETKKGAAALADIKAEASSGFDPSKLLAGAGAGLDSVDKEVHKVIDGAVVQVGTIVDNKMKEADQVIDQKREEVVKVVQDEAQKAASTGADGIGSVLGKAKGLLNF